MTPTKISESEENLIKIICYTLIINYITVAPMLNQILMVKKDTQTRRKQGDRKSNLEKS